MPDIFFIYQLILYAESVKLFYEDNTVRLITSSARLALGVSQVFFTAFHPPAPYGEEWLSNIEHRTPLKLQDLR